MRQGDDPTGREAVATRLAGLALLTATLALAACAPGRPALTRFVLRAGGHDITTAHFVAQRAKDAEIVYLGELHDNPHHHAGQAAVLEALILDGARPAVAFEMLGEEQQATADELLESDLLPSEWDYRLRWRARGWPEFSMYWPVFDQVRRRRLPLVAIDLDPALTRRIAREGLEGAGPRREQLGSRLRPDAERERRLAAILQEAHCNRMPEERLPRMIESWHARNVTMARNLIAALGRAPQVVVIIGRGHQAPGGVPAQLLAMRPRTRQLVVEFVEAEPREPTEAAAARATGDVVWVTPPVPRPDPCKTLRLSSAPGHAVSGGGRSGG